MPRQNSKEITAIITQAVNAGIRAGRDSAFKNHAQIYKAVERRIFAIPMLEQKIEEDKEKIAEIQNYGTAEKSKSIVRFQRTGVRLSDDEIIEAMIHDLNVSIMSNEFELNTLNNALKRIEKDSYYLAVHGKYIDLLTDDTIASAISCDASTVRRNRGRLIRTLAVWLYGAEAL